MKTTQVKVNKLILIPLSKSDSNAILKSSWWDNSFKLHRSAICNWRFPDLSKKCGKCFPTILLSISDGTKKNILTKTTSPCLSYWINKDISLCWSGSMKHSMIKYKLAFGAKTRWSWWQIFNCATLTNNNIRKKNTRNFAHLQKIKLSS